MESNSDLVWTWLDPLPIHYAGCRKEFGDKSLETSVGVSRVRCRVVFFLSRATPPTVFMFYSSSLLH